MLVEVIGRWRRQRVEHINFVRLLKAGTLMYVKGRVHK